MSSKKYAVSNSGPLIHLAKADLLILLQLYEILIPEEVRYEVVDIGRKKGHPDALLIEKKIKEGEIKVVSVKVPEEFLVLAEEFGAHPAEASVIYYAKKIDGMALLDDDPARQLARALGVCIRGSLGLLLEGLDRGIISYKKAIEGLNRLSEIMYLSSDIYKEVLQEIERRGKTASVEYGRRKSKSH